MEQTPDISFIVPTYGEAANLELLVEHIQTGLQDSELSWELIIANDDSGDNTAAVCNHLAATAPVRLLNRTENRGLALAVIDGVNEATGEIIVVMDADQSHPSSVVPQMVQLLREDKADFVLGSRKINAASVDEKWPLIRHLGTFFATTLVAPLVAVKDPLAGFFALRRTDWPQKKLQPLGFKIALELMVRGSFARERIVEVPIHFSDRKVGKSKMGWRELNNYLRHVLMLYCFRWPLLRFFMHGGVGTLGLLIDLSVYFLLQAGGVSHLWARGISYWPATTSNWWLNRVYTYCDRPLRSKWQQWFEFIQVTLIGFFVNYGTYHLLTTQVAWFFEHKTVALLIGVVVGLAINFIGSNLQVYGNKHQHLS